MGEVILSAMMVNDYFDQKPPKFLGINTFDINTLSKNSENDGAATLTTFTAASVARAEAFFPAPAQRWLVTGGGRLNPALKDDLSAHLEAPVQPVEGVGWYGDALEAQAFAYLAVRSPAGLPLSYPTTTESAAPTPGGQYEKSPGEAISH